MEKVGLDYISSKIKTKNDILDFFRETGKWYFIKNKGFYFPNAPGFDSKFFFQVLQGSKKVK